MGWGAEEENPGRVILPLQSEPSGRMKEIDNVPSEMIKLSAMTQIQSLLILDANQNDTKGLNMSQI